MRDSSRLTGDELRVLGELELKKWRFANDGMLLSCERDWMKRENGEKVVGETEGDEEEAREGRWTRRKDEVGLGGSARRYKPQLCI